MRKMKKIFSAFAFLLSVVAAGLIYIPASAAGDVKINSTNFPDSTFRSYVSTNFDTDKNGSLSSTEIANATRIDLLGKTAVKNIKGIQYFTSLSYLDLTGTYVTSMDLSKNTQLTKLYCNTRLTSLNVSKNTKLEVLFCSGLTSLDVTQNTKLQRLSCTFKSGQYSKLNISKNTELTYLDTAYVKDLDITKNTKLQTVYLSHISGTVDFSKNSELVSLMYLSSPITSVDLSKNTKLERLYLNDNKLKSLDVSKNPLLYVLDCGYNNLTSLDVSKNTKLDTLIISDNQIKSINVSNNKALWALYVGNNNLSSLDVSKNTELRTICCYGNSLTSINLKNNKKLERFECHNNKITSLDLENNTMLDKLLCYGNSISKLNISTNPGLIEAYKKGTKIEPGVYYSFSWVTKFDSNTEGKYLKNEDYGYRYIIYKKGMKVTTDGKPLPITLTSTSGGNVKIAWEAFSKNGKNAVKYEIYKKSGSKWKKIGSTTGLSYKDSSAIPGDPNTYTVLALDSDGKAMSGYGDGTSISFLADAIPVTVTNKAAGILVQWNGVVGADKYEIFRKTKKGSWERLAATTNLQYSDKKAVFSTAYIYTVRAKTKKGNYSTKYGNGTSITRFVSGPEITLDNIAKGVEVRWKAMSNAEKYRVYVKNADGSWKRIAIVTGKSYVDKDVAKGNKYTYAVVGLDSNGKAMNDYGKGVSITRKVVSPTSVVATVKSSGIRTEWSAVSGAASYKVYRKTGTTSWKAIGTTSGTSYIDKSVTTGTYYYSVVALNSRGKALNDYGNGVKVKFTATSTKSSTTKKGFAEEELLGEGIVEEILEDEAVEVIEEESEEEIGEEDSEEELSEEDSEEEIVEEETDEETSEEEIGEETSEAAPADSVDEEATGDVIPDEVSETETEEEVITAESDAE